MLNRKIQIVTDFIFFFNRLDQFIVNLLRITIKNSDPLDSGYFTKLTEQFVQGFLSIYILSVYGRFLCNKNQFFYSLISQVFRFCQQLLHRNTAVITTKFWDDTVSTMLVTAFGNFHVCIMPACCYKSLFFYIWKCIHIFQNNMSISRKSLFHRFYDMIIRSSSKYCINFRYLVNNLLLIALCQTPGHDQSFQLPFFFVLCHLKNGLNTFLLCIMNKTAGINNNNICVFF